jgi:hypothetical protein
MSIRLPDMIQKGLRIKARRKATLAFVKLFLIWGALGVFCYFAANDAGGKFNPTTAPIIFWSIVALLVIVPPSCLRIWRYLVPFAVRGTVIRKKDCLMNIQTKRNTGRVRSFRGWDMRNVDTCQLLWQTDKGMLRMTNISLPERAEMARAYYREGDRVVLYRCAAVPFCEARLPAHPLCLSCGNVAKDHEVHCSSCGLLLLQERDAENEQLNAAEETV